MCQTISATTEPTIGDTGIPSEGGDLQKALKTIAVMNGEEVLDDKKTLLLDIDYTLFDERTPRPYLKEFLTKMREKYHIHFYTAAGFNRVTEVCRILHHDLGFDAEFIKHLQRHSLRNDNCEMIDCYTKDGGSIKIKCMTKASQVLNVPIDNLLLLDDNPTWGHPQANQIVQAEGFMAWNEDEDDYLNRLEITDDMFKGTPDGVERGTVYDFKTSKDYKIGQKIENPFR